MNIMQLVHITVYLHFGARTKYKVKLR